MAIALEGQIINSILIVDDDPAARDAFSYTISDMGLTPICEKGPLDDLGRFVETLPEKADAVFSDYRLKPRNYSVFEGDILVAECYSHGIPAVLCTRFPSFDLDRSLIRKIPVLLHNTNPEPDEVVTAFKKCLAELKGYVAPSRRAWRSLVRVLDINPGRRLFYVIVPGWDANTEVCLYMDNIPEEIRDLIQPGKRFHAKVNIGAQSEDDLYFYDWEAE